MLLPFRTAAPQALFGVGLAAGLLLGITAAGAGVTSSTQTEAYRVSGATAADLVAYMRYHPYPGDHGDAVANIRPNYTLSVATKDAGGACKASSVNLNIRFSLVLPQATQTAAMSSSTRAAWNSFAAFARRHEETHRSIYLQCAAEFVAKAMRQTSGSCFSLQANIKDMLEAEKRACDLRQNAFDRAQYRIVLYQNLFALAKYSGRKPGHAAPVSGPSSALEAPR
jgi:predicted secreted Zn-dependent protease